MLFLDLIMVLIKEEIQSSSCTQVNDKEDRQPLYSVGQSATM